MEYYLQQLLYNTEVEGEHKMLTLRQQCWLGAPKMSITYRADCQHRLSGTAVAKSHKEH